MGSFVKGSAADLTRKILEWREDARPIEIKEAILSRYGKSVALGAVTSARKKYFLSLGKSLPITPYEDRNKPPRPEFTNSENNALGVFSPRKESVRNKLPEGVTFVQLVRNKLMLDETLTPKEIQDSIKKEYGLDKVSQSVVSMARKSYFRSLGKEVPELSKNYPVFRKLTQPSNGSVPIDQVLSLYEIVKSIGRENVEKLLSVY